MSTELDTCGCETTSTDVEIDNASGLSELSWRVGTWSTFYTRMRAALPTTGVEDGSPSFKPLAGLTARATDDPTIALLDAVACVLDVLTFYQERIANEGFLRTATEDLSLHNMARMIGYSRSPGVAANVYLAFTVNEADGGPVDSTVAAGTQVTSVPGQGETAQTFETSEEVYCHQDWNAMVMQTREKHTTARAESWAGGLENRTIIVSGINLRISVGDRILIVDPNEFVDGASEDALLTPLGNGYSTRRVVKVVEYKDYAVTALHFEMNLPLFQVFRQWPYNLYDGLEYYVFRAGLPAFGYNAPEIRLDVAAASPLAEWVPNDVSGTDVAIETRPLGAYSPGAWTIRLAGEVPQVVPDTYCYIRGTWEDTDSPGNTSGERLYMLQDASLGTTTAYTISGKTTNIVLSTKPWYTDPRNFQAWVAPEQLTLADIPITDDVVATTSEIIVDGALEEMEAGRLLVFADGKYSEVATVSKCVKDEANGITTITLSQGLTNTYTRASLVIYGNVVVATHGVSIAQTLGDGDGAEANQAFTLTTTPLTHLLSSSDGGTASTLVVTVGGETWTSATSFYGEGPSDRIYTEHLDDDDYTVVTFGDGVAGARLPTGSANVTATWRTGLGTAGNVDAGKIAQLRAKPLGVKGVTNPIAASGGADAEALEDIRANVPSAALLLDRLVSVSDYAAYANAFASIGLARADVLRVGRRRVITISALDSSGDPVVVGETLELALSEAITACKDAAAEFKVVPARIYTFNVSISVLLDDGQTAESVGIEDALAAAFAWTERDFHEGVTTSEVMAVVQALDGVKSVIVAALLMYDDADEYVEVSANRIDPPGASATDDGVYTGAALLVYKSDESTALSYIYQQGT